MVNGSVWLVVTSALLLACRVAVRAAYRARATDPLLVSVMRLTRTPSAQRVLLLFNPPRWVAWTAAWVTASVEAHATHESTAWLSDLPPATLRTLYIAPVLFWAVGGGPWGYFWVMFVVAAEHEEEDMIECVQRLRPAARSLRLGFHPRSPAGVRRESVHALIFVTVTALGVFRDVPFALADGPWVCLAALKQLATWKSLAQTALFAATRVTFLFMVLFSVMADLRAALAAWLRLTRALQCDSLALANYQS